MNPAQVDDTAGGLAEGTAMSMDIVRESLFGSLGFIARMVIPIVLVAAAIALVVLVAVCVKRVRAEVRSGRQSLDPRPLVDPFASDVLGEW